jgi:serine/threonine-protein kinase
LSTARRQLIDQIYSQALALAGPERERFVAERAGDDAELCRHVLDLLVASETADERLAGRFAGIRERMWRTALTNEGDLEEDLSGQRVHTWFVEKRIARGGLATVYLARRDDGSFDQTVALKVLRRGLDTDDVVARFRAERQILSALEHPAIAQILDGGALEDGRPYLVLEYVDGLPITTHCEQNGITVRGRLLLLIEVLRALHHAHTHLVVHRDVKPSNILVSTAGRIALLDFGIAKLLDPNSMPGASTATRTGVSLLTPGYASPEQFAGQAVSTASDVYQVGLVMYELLTGSRPFETAGNRVDSDPAPPSRALRGTSRYKLVHGDLDAITLKAMHADPAQRYASADEMVSDLMRHLDGLPVIARPDTLRYRLTKLAKRRPWLAPIVATAVLAVAAYVVTLTIYSNRVAREERLAAAAQRFMVDLFRSPDPYAPADPERGRDITVVEALALGQARVRNELSDQPQLKASLLVSISNVYGSLDQSEDAISLREEALELEREIHGRQSREVIASLRFLGAEYDKTGDIALADNAFAEQLAITGELFTEDDPEFGLAQIASGMHENSKGNDEFGRTLMAEGVEKLRRAPVFDAPPLISALIELAEQHDMESADAAFAAIKEAQAVADTVFGADSLQSALVRIRLASSMTIFGDYSGSEHNFQVAIPVLEARLGNDHSSTLAALNNLGYLYSRSNDQASAERIHREILARRIARHGAIHRSVADSYQNLAGAITRLGRYDESIPLHRKAYETYQAVLNEDNYVIGLPLLSTAYAELQRDDAVVAEAAAREALSHMEATVPGTFFEGVARCLVGLSLEAQGNAEEGGALVFASHELMKGSSIPDPYPALCRLPE